MPVSVNKSLAASYILEDPLGRIANDGVALNLGRVGLKGYIDITAPQFNFTFVYGQSLSVGDGGIPNVRNTAELAGFGDDVNLYQGVDTNGPGAAVIQYTSTDVAALKPYAEYDTYQSHGWGYYNYLKSKGKLAGNKRLYASVGVGAKTVAELSAAPIYNNVPTVINAVSEVKPSGFAFGRSSIHYIQGEADTTPQTPPEQWKTAVLNLINGNIKPLINSETGGAGADVYITQLGKGNTHPQGGYAIANAQLELVVANAGFHMPVAGWVLNYVYGRTDYQPHLTSQGYDLMGEYIAEAEILVSAGASKITPPRPVSFAVQPNQKTVLIEFENPYGYPLTIDSSGSIVPSLPSAGFGVGNRSNVDDILPCTGVSLTGNILSVTSPQIIEVGTNLTAGRINFNWPANTAFRLPLINLRDTSPKVSPSLGVPMYNWAAQFTKVFAAGESNVFNDKTDNIWNANVDPAFATPKSSVAAATVLTAWGLNAYDRIYPNSVYEVTFDITIVSGSFRLSVGSSTDGLRETFTLSGTYTRTVSIISANGLKADALGTNHNITLNSISVVKIA